MLWRVAAAGVPPRRGRGPHGVQPEVELGRNLIVAELRQGAWSVSWCFHTDATHRRHPLAIATAQIWRRNDIVEDTTSKDAFPVLGAMPGLVARVGWDRRF